MLTPSQKVSDWHGSTPPPVLPMSKNLRSTTTRNGDCNERLHRAMNLLAAPVTKIARRAARVGLLETTIQAHAVSMSGISANFPEYMPYVRRGYNPTSIQATFGNVLNCDI